MFSQSSGITHPCTQALDNPMLFITPMCKYMLIVFILSQLYG